MSFAVPTVTTRPTSPIPASARIHSTTTTRPASALKTPASATGGARATGAGAAATATRTVPNAAVPRTTTSAVPTTGATTPTAAVPAGSAAKPLSSTAANGRAGGRAAAHGSGHISTEAVVLAAIAVLLLLACAVWAFARSRAYEPRWLLSLRHAMAEAGYRMSATWAEFVDWARLGR
jgi:hypothetical protein